MSATSNSVMPASMAAFTTACEPSGVWVAVCGRPRLLQPSPVADTARPDRPRRRKLFSPMGSGYDDWCGVDEGGVGEGGVGAGCVGGVASGWGGAVVPPRWKVLVKR